MMKLFTDAVKGDGRLPIAVGVIAGFALGLVNALWQIIAHQYIHYKLFKSILLTIQGAATYVLFMTVGLLVFHLLCALVIKLFKWDPHKVIMTDLLFIGAVFALFIIDRLLKEFTFYTLELGLEKFIERLGGIFTGAGSFGGFLRLLKKNLPAVVFFVIGVAGVLVFFWFIKKLNWEKAAGFLERKAAGLRKTSLALILFLLVLSVGIAVEERLNPPKGPNIVIIVSDCLRADHLGCYGYHRDTAPVIDRLAREGLRFTRAYSNAPWTKPSVMSIFTSLYPNTHGVIGLSDLAPSPSLTIAEALKNHGYETHCLVGGNTALRAEFNYSQGFDTYINTMRIFPSGGPLTDKFLSLIPTSKNKRFFAYLHYMDTHLPYRRYNERFVEEKGDIFAQPDTLDQHDLRQWTADGKVPDKDKNHLVSLYDGQIRIMDGFVGKIIAALKEKDLLDNTLVIFTSDHGEEFWEHQNILHAHTLYNELLHIPLIMTGYGLEPKIIDNRVTLVDLMPTILGTVNHRAQPAKRHGSDILKAVKEGGRAAAAWGSPIFATGTLYGDEKFCLIGKDNWKLIVNTKNKKDKGELVGYSETAKTELYNLNTDPLEKTNLHNSEKEKLTALKQALQIHAGNTPIFKRKKKALDKKTKEKLKSLGYL